ncbi:salicylic acid-binding protein 2-like isoform X2 [Magnolia sinica]|uniref:salicylic acid-binding protein 2-like isoform X2 n=1 Tax=Magnolia sinica TaxID=86752 RepID=UPI00265867CC|nr:salicylic acid-binding protein 2-like isoform X2 [Magnolia sinica]
MEVGKNKKHFVLVHGACHGAWCWYKVATLLTSAGNRVTAVDLAASGINPKKFEDEVLKFSEYSLPLLDIMASLPPQERVILVGHSLGGLNLALAMDKYPEKVSVAVFLTAFMPDSSNRPSYILDKYFERTPLELFLDTQFQFDRGPEKPATMLFGPKFLSQKLYQRSSPEDYTLATTLVRVGSLFQEDLSNAPFFSKERYGSVTRVFIVCDEDMAIPDEFQHWMVENNPVKEVKVINGSDHMPMFCKAQELCHSLLEIAERHA